MRLRAPSSEAANEWIEWLTRGNQIDGRATWGGWVASSAWESASGAGVVQYDDDGIPIVGATLTDDPRTSPVARSGGGSGGASAAGARVRFAVDRDDAESADAPTWSYPEEEAGGAGVGADWEHAHDGGEVEYDEEEVAAHQAAIDAAGGWTILDDTTSGGIYCASHAACASRPVGARRRVACTFLTPPTLSAARFRADYNTYSNESTYDMPPEFAEIAASRDAWQEMADGQWQNQVTGEISAAGWVGHGVAAGGVTPRSAPAEQGSPGWASAQGWDSTCTSDDEQGF